MARKRKVRSDQDLMKLSLAAVGEELGFNERQMQVLMYFMGQFVQGFLDGIVEDAKAKQIAMQQAMVLAQLESAGHC